MLEQLIVKNIALISSIEINFNNGLDVLTGETGAGKSIILDSIGLLLGERADKDLIRSGENECKVIGKFIVDKGSRDSIKSICLKFNIDYSDEFVISRSFNRNGRGDVRINGEPVTLAMLKEFSSYLVNIYQQNDNQIIFNSSNHLRILDDFALTYQEPFFKEYTEYYNRLCSINELLYSYGGDDTDRARKMDLLQYQKTEIENAKLSQEEFVELDNKRLKLMNLGKIVANASTAESCLKDTDYVTKAKYALEQASGYDDKLNSYVDRLNSVELELEDIFNDIKAYIDESDFSEEEQNRIIERLEVYKNLFRKYGSSVEEVNDFLNKVTNELEGLENSKEQIYRLNLEKQKVLSLLFDLGEKISVYRRTKAEQLCNLILNNLHKLGMNDSKIKFQFLTFNKEESSLYKTGLDQVELLFSANAGEAEKPLQKIASGGEISRFMLALKSVIASVDKMPTMIFDEIDTGISGKTSEAVAKQMANIARCHQVIVVTHSSQIAAMADFNYYIYKKTENGFTNTYVKLLSPEEKVDEVARFLSGAEISNSAIKNAQELIDEQKKYKLSLK